MSENASGEASSGRRSNGKKPPHKCFGCDKEYARPHKRLEHMRDCCPEKLDKCPTCGTGYTNEYGVKMHHSRQHGESIAKTDFYCERCGDFYKEIYESEVDEYTHCKDCRPKVKSERMSGKDNPQYGTGETIEFDCEYCGTHRERLQSASSTTFCDVECRNAWMTEVNRGENHPSWNGGKEHYYGPEWPEQREKCLERDDYRCQGCGKHNSEASIALNAHHIKPYKTFDYREEANKVDNLVALCIGCHNDWEGIPVRPTLD